MSRNVETNKLKEILEYFVLQKSALINEIHCLPCCNYSIVYNTKHSQMPCVISIGTRVCAILRTEQTAAATGVYEVQTTLHGVDAVCWHSQAGKYQCNALASDNRIRQK